MKTRPMSPDIRAAIDKINEKRMKTIIRLYQEGRTTEDVAIYLGLSRQRIHQICKAAGFPIQRQSRYCGRHK